MAKIGQKTMDAIAVYMDDDKRDQVHFELDQDFEDVLKSEFGIEL